MRTFLQNQVNKSESKQKGKSAGPRYDERKGGQKGSVGCPTYLQVNDRLGNIVIKSVGNSKDWEIAKKQYQKIGSGGF